MLWFKGCPKCHGDLYKRQDFDGNEIVCIQCGFQVPALRPAERLHPTRQQAVAA